MLLSSYLLSLSLPSIYDGELRQKHQFLKGPSIFIWQYKTSIWRFGWVGVLGGWVDKIWVTLMLWPNYMLTFFEQKWQLEKYLVQPPSAKNPVLFLTVSHILRCYSRISTMVVLAHDPKSSTFHRRLTGFCSMFADLVHRFPLSI